MEWVVARNCYICTVKMTTIYSENMYDCGMYIDYYGYSNYTGK